MAPRETENNAYAKFGVTNKEHYGMLWYFLEWSIANVRRMKDTFNFVFMSHVLYITEHLLIYFTYLTRGMHNRV